MKRHNNSRQKKYSYNIFKQLHLAHNHTLLYFGWYKSPILAVTRRIRELGNFTCVE